METVRIERAGRRLSDSFPELKCKVDRTGFFARGAIYYEIFRRQADVGQPPTPFSHPIRWQFSTTRLPGLTRQSSLICRLFSSNLPASLHPSATRSSAELQQAFLKSLHVYSRQLCPYSAYTLVPPRALFECGYVKEALNQSMLRAT